MLNIGINILLNDQERLEYPFKLNNGIKFESYSSFQIYLKEQTLSQKESNLYLEKRLHILEPLINKKNPSIKELKEIANRNGHHWQTIYCWWNAYLENGIEGLKPKFDKKGRKRKRNPILNRELDVIFSDYIRNECNISIRELNRQFQEKMRVLGFSGKSISYESFRREINRRKIEMKIESNPSLKMEM